MSITTLVTVCGWTTFTACILVFLSMMIKIESNKWISGVVTKYIKVIEVTYVTSCVTLFFTAAFIASLTIYDPQRMTNYLTNIVYSLWMNIRNY